MKNIRVFLSENFQFLQVKFSIYLNRRVYVMVIINCIVRKTFFLFYHVILNISQIITLV